MNCKLDVNSYVHRNVKKTVGNIGEIDLNSGIGTVNQYFGKTNLDVIKNLNERFGEKVISYTLSKDNDLPGTVEIKLSDRLYEHYLKKYGKATQEARDAQKEDAERAGLNYTDDYLFQLNKSGITPKSIIEEKEEFEKEGITLTQKDNIPLINKLLYKSITPATYNLKYILTKGFYSLFVGRSYSDFIKTIEFLKSLNINMPEWADNISEEQYNKRDDAWALSNGLPQKHNTFKYVGKGYVENGAIVYDVNGEDIYDFVNPEFNDADLNKSFKKGYGTDKGNFVMGNYGVSTGRDETGYYLKYTDRWDLDITNKFAQKVIDSTQKPFIVSGKLYKALTLDENGNESLYYTSVSNNEDINRYIEFMAILESEETINKENITYNDNTISSKASPETIKLVNNLLKQIGVNVNSVKNIVVNGKKIDANGVAKTMQKLIEVVQGKEATALPEEAMHFVVEIIKQTNPALYKKLMSQINDYKIKNQVFAEYGTDPNYQIDGKPDVIKLKEEAIAKLLVETIINQNENSTEKPELLAKVEKDLWNSILDWIKNLFIKNGFDKLALDIISGKELGTADDIKNGGTFLQKGTSIQEEIINKFKEVASNIQKDPGGKPGYEADGKQTRRVSDLVKNYYDRIFPNSDLTKSEQAKAIDTLKADKGTDGHSDLEYIQSLFVDENGGMRNVPLDDSGYVSKLNPNNRDAYDILKKNLEERLKSFPEGTKFLAEQIIFDQKRNIAGTVDFLAITPEGKVSILDWKFMDLNTDKNSDLPWYKIGGWNVQMEQYKYIISSIYGVKASDFDQTRMIPIKVHYTEVPPKSNELPKLIRIEIGDVNVKNIKEDYLLPYSLKEESSGNKEIDELLLKLNKTYESLSKEKVVPTNKAKKAEQLNALFYAIRQLQMKQNLKPLLYQAKVLNKKVKETIDTYEKEYEGKDPKDFTSVEKQDEISKLSIEIDTLNKALDNYLELDLDLEFLFENDNSQESKDLKQEVREAVDNARVFKRKLNTTDTKLTTNFIGGTSSSEKIIRGFTKFFSATSTLQLKSIQALYKKANKVFAYAGMDTLRENKRLTNLKNNYQLWANSKGLTMKNMFDIIQKKDKNELIDQYNPKFYSELKEKIRTKDTKWILNNIDTKEYIQHIKEVKKRELESVNERFNSSLKTNEDEQKRNNEIIKINKLYDTSDLNSSAYLLYNEIKLFPKKEIWTSKEWQELTKPENKPAKDFYDYIIERNNYYQDIGYIQSKEARVFLPWVRKNYVEKLIFGGKMTLGDQFLKSISVDESDTGYGELDPHTGKPVDKIPKYLTTAFEGDYSRDLFKTMSMYNEFAIKFNYLSSIEAQAKALLRLERNKQSISTSRWGTTEREESGDLRYNPDNSENSDLLEKMIKAIVYQQKYVDSGAFDMLLGKFGNATKKINDKIGYKVFPEDISERQLSVNKLVDTLNTTFQMTTLGLNLLSATSNYFGGNAQSAINAGKYFNKAELLAVEMWLLTNKMRGPDTQLKLAMLDYFIPFTENYNRDSPRKLSLNKLDEQAVQDYLMVLMREGDRAVQTMNFFAFANNAIVQDGKIVNVREYLRSTPEYNNMYLGNQQERDARAKKFEEDVKKLKEEKGIVKLGKVINGEFVLEGIEQKSEGVIELRRLTQQFTSDALGNLTEENKRLINMSIYGNSFMVFKNWIPRLVDVRIGNLKYNSGYEAYEWGRSRMITNIISDDILKSLGRMINAVKGNDKGIDYVREMFEKKKAQYEADTGKILEMTESEFIDLVRQNIKNQALDLIILLSLWSLILLLKAALPDEEEDPAIRNRAKFMLKATDKLKDELQYFYDFTSFTGLISKGIFPAMGLLTNYGKVLENFTKEMYGLGVNDEDLLKKNYVIKYLMKSFPISNQASGYLPLFFPELAKDLGIRVQSQYGIR